MAWRGRLDVQRRLAGAKASLPDEFLTLSQLTVGSLLSIEYKDNKDVSLNLQYDETGKAFHLYGVQQPNISYSTPSSSPAPLNAFLTFGAQGISTHAVINENIAVPSRTVQVMPEGEESFWHITGHARFFILSTNAFQLRLRPTAYVLDTDVLANVKQIGISTGEIVQYMPPTGAVPMPKEITLPINAVMLLRQVAFYYQLIASEITLPPGQTQLNVQVGLEVTLCGHYIGKENRTDRHELVEYD